jgi:hypothetical protein
MTLNVSSLAELSSLLEKGGNLFLSGCAAEIPGFCDLEVFQKSSAAANISGIFLPGLNRQDYTALGERVTWQTFFKSPVWRAMNPESATAL